ncbi:elongation factor P [Borreliella burgdorferi]|uniref:elongation factor P n=1 Tax=Borreliella burgdorferi TaxID=139 RepID=UPI0001F23B41|nr:elongation factor P [Borreliella burgdorferi]ADQ31093.1 translation elongation factor P [Borreliella burgdorferi JD1]MCD2373913.1 elongation factor P [Borreliella burgdorferi]MCD2375121.1 elongation factor P [Borreliella burgdorferi]MCD2383466.1 elongation factor P [Borreliella burgdorferi]MCD2384490.1 elongation factor P [Borreliella burgdorferi]
MAVVKSSEIEKGSFLLIKGVPHIVLEREFSKTGRGGAIVRLKLKNLKNKFVIRETLKGADTAEAIEIYEVSAQYLYKDKDVLVFMDLETYDQVSLDLKESANLQDKVPFLQESEIYSLVTFDNVVIDIKLAPKIAFEVVEVEAAVKGDTVTNAMKNITLNTGLVVKAPLFINVGDKVLINSETKEYAERIKN